MAFYYYLTIKHNSKYLKIKIYMQTSSFNKWLCKFLHVNRTNK